MDDSMMVSDIMTLDPAFCIRSTPIQEVARMMVENDCGAIPVFESEENSKPVGIITDRDITCRLVAQGKNPLESAAQDAMTPFCVTIPFNTSVDHCCKIMEEHQLRRILVVDEDGGCCGIVAQADIARHAPTAEVGEVVEEVSQPLHPVQK